MTTLTMHSGSGLRGPLRGWAISLAVHALVLAWLVHAVPASRYLHDRRDDAPVRHSQLILVPVRPLPAPASVPLPRPAAESRPASRRDPGAAPAARVRPAPATAARRAPATAPSAPSAPPRDAAPPVPALPAATQAPPAAVTEETAPDAAPGPAPAPGFDIQAARGAVRSALKERIGDPKPRPAPTLKATQDEKLSGAIDRARRGDCQTQYAGLGLLAVIPLAVDTVTGSGCKWK